MSDIEYTDQFAKGYLTGEIETLKHLLCKIRSECSFGIITYSYLENVLTQMIDKAGGECLMEEINRND